MTVLSSDVLIANGMLPFLINFISAMNLFKNTLKGVVPVAATIYFAYAISVVFKEIAMEEAVQQWFLYAAMGIAKSGFKRRLSLAISGLPDMLL